MSGSVVDEVFTWGSMDWQMRFLGEEEKLALHLTLESPSCGLEGLNLTVDDAETELSSAQEAMLLDDPGTSTPNDYSLHPCECFPESWGSSAALPECAAQGAELQNRHGGWHLEK